MESKLYSPELKNPLDIDHKIIEKKVYMVDETLFETYEEAINYAQKNALNDIITALLYDSNFSFGANLPKDQIINIIQDWEINRHKYFPQETINTLNTQESSPNNLWQQLIQDMGLTGMTKELAKYCTPKRIDIQEFVLQLPSELSLLECNHTKHKLEEALRKHFNSESLKLTIQLQETP